VGEPRRFENFAFYRINNIRRLKLFWIWDTELAANLACEEIGDFDVSWNRGNAAWIREIDVLAIFDPSSASVHPKRSRCRMSSRRFT
jgi:hypothetical protein